MSLRRAVLRLGLIAVLVASGCAADQPEETQPSAVQAYDVPDGSRPHDVAPADDGGVWFTGQRAGFLGHFNPSTQAVKQVPLGEGSAPHGVIVGPDGAAWVTDGGLNAIVRVDSTTHEVRSYPLPTGREGANLNTASFDRDGMLWFTGQAGVYGQLDPRTGSMTVYDAPRGLGRTALPRHPAVRSITPLWRATTSGALTPRPARRQCSNPQRHSRAPVASGRTAPDGSG